MDDNQLQEERKEESFVAHQENPKDFFGKLKSFFTTISRSKLIILGIVIFMAIGTIAAVSLSLQKTIFKQGAHIAGEQCNSAGGSCELSCPTNTNSAGHSDCGTEYCCFPKTCTPSQSTTCSGPETCTLNIGSDCSSIISNCHLVNNSCGYHAPTPTPTNAPNPKCYNNLGTCYTNNTCGANLIEVNDSATCAKYKLSNGTPYRICCAQPFPACGTGSASKGVCVFNVNFQCPQADYVQGTCTSEQFSCCSITPTPTPIPGYSCTHKPDTNRANTVGACVTQNLCNLNCSDCDVNNDCISGQACCHNLTSDTPTPTPTKVPPPCTSNCGGGGGGGGGGNPTATPISCTNGHASSATLSVKLPGIGSGNFENSTPEHTTLHGEVDVVNPNGTNFSKSTQSFTFDGQNYVTRSVSFGTNLNCSNSYKVRVKIPRYLGKFSNETFHVGNSNTLTFTPLAGDVWPIVKNNSQWVVKGDNVLNAQDYNIFLLCYNHAITDAIPVTDGSGITASCDVANIFDESDQTTVLGGEPYNLFLRGEITACAANNSCQGD